jgi:hypothetical protein
VQEARPQLVVEKVTHGQTFTQDRHRKQLLAADLTHSRELNKDFKKALNRK